MKVLALSGSLRAASINSALLRAAAHLAPPEMRVSVFGGMAELPLFNPDRESALPLPVAAFHAAVADADALLIASPEYAHGVSGVIKNALDWLVSFEPFIYKPVAVLNASPRARHADAALRETLSTMSAVIVEEASVSIALLGAHRDKDSMLADAVVSGAIRGSLRALHEAVTQRQSVRGPAFRWGDRMTRISSKSLTFTKRIFPLLWFGIIAAAVAVVLLSGAFVKAPFAIIVPCVMAVFGYLLMRKLVWDMVDEVYDCGDYLLVKNGGQEEHVPLSNIMNVNASTLVNPPRITLRLVTPGRFGGEIAFSPVKPFTLNPFARNAVADDLIARTYRARTRAGL